jgi:hypothetical protein
MLQGALSKGSGSFYIDHPVKPKTHTLRYGFVESPRYDLHHRGTTRLVNGKAIINLDAYYGLMAGTFETLNKDATVNSLIAPNSWVRLKASRVEGSKFTIEADDKEFCGEVKLVGDWRT